MAPIPPVGTQPNNVSGSNSISDFMATLGKLGNGSDFSFVAMSKAIDSLSEEVKQSIQAVKNLDLLAKAYSDQIAKLNRTRSAMDLDKADDGSWSYEKIMAYRNIGPNGDGESGYLNVWAAAGETLRRALNDPEYAKQIGLDGIIQDNMANMSGDEEDDWFAKGNCFFETDREQKLMGAAGPGGWDPATPEGHRMTAIYNKLLMDQVTRGKLLGAGDINGESGYEQAGLNEPNYYVDPANGGLCKGPLVPMGNPKPGCVGVCSRTDIQNLIDKIGKLKEEVSSQRQIGMVLLNDLVSKKGQAIQLLTNINKAENDNMKTVLGHFR